MQRVLKSLILGATVVLVLVVAVLNGGCQNRVAQSEADATGAEHIAERSQAGDDEVLRPVRYSMKIHSGSSGALLPTNIDTQLVPLLAKFDEWDEVIRVVITGHTDAEGSEQSNVRLSFRRARALADKLIDYGFPSAVIEVNGRGEADPIASNTSISGKQLNRRVEVVVEGLQALDGPSQLGWRD